MNRLISVLWLAFILPAFGQSFTMDYAHHGATTLTSPTLYPATNLTLFTYYGLPVTNYSMSSNVVCATGISGPAGNPPIQASFDLTGTNCELIVNNFAYPTNTWGITFWELTDGVTTSDYRSNSLGNWGANTAYIPVTFASNGVHHLRFSIHGNFGGVNATSGNTVSAHKISPKPNLLMVLGDSYVQGYIPPPDSLVDNTWSSYWFGGWVWDLVKLVPNTIAIPSGLGGTGFVQTNGVSVNYAGRVVPDICTLYTNAVSSGLYNKIFITASGSINDDGQDTNALYINATNVYATIKAACPDAYVFFIGNWYANYGHAWAVQQTNNIILTRAASDLSIPYYSPVNALLLDGMGISNGNYYTFMGNDHAHPTAYGYSVMANWVNTNLANTFGTNWSAGGAGTNPPAASAKLYLPLSWR